MMEIEFIEKYEVLKDLEPGEIAVSKDRQSLFLCARVNEKEFDLVTFINLSRLYMQSHEEGDINQPVRKLKKGDKFVITL